MTKQVKQKTIVIQDDPLSRAIGLLIAKIDNAQKLLRSLQDEIKIQQASIADSLRMIAESNIRIADKLNAKIERPNSLIPPDYSSYSSTSDCGLGQQNHCTRGSDGYCSSDHCPRFKRVYGEPPKTYFTPDNDSGVYP